MKEFYPVILAPLITQAAAERNQSAAASKEIKFTSFSDLKFKFISFRAAEMKALCLYSQ